MDKNSSSSRSSYKAKQELTQFQNITAGTTNRSVTVSNVDRTVQNALVSSLAR